MPFDPHKRGVTYDQGTAYSAFNTAYDFLRIARLDRVPTVNPIDYAGIAIASLSAEIFVKANYIFSNNKEPPKGHNLKALIETCLTEEERQDLIEVLRSFLGRDPWPLVESHSSFFELYRYHYELTSTFHMSSFNLNLAEVVGAITYVHYVRRLNTSTAYEFSLHNGDEQVPFIECLSYQ